MTNSPVLELQSLARDINSDIVGVLMQAKTIAVKLGLDELSDWIEYEIEGYPKNIDIPEYRTGQGIVKVWNPYRGWENIDFSNIPPSTITEIQRFRIVESIASMQRQKVNEGMLSLTMNPKLVSFLFGAAGTLPHVQWFFSANKLDHIVTTVRNKILNWSLELEQKGIMGEGLLFSQKEKEAAHMTVHNITNILGNVTNAGVIGSGNGDIIQHNTIAAGDFNSLEKQLKEWGISDEDVKTLRRAVEESPVPISADNFGSKIGGWLGNIIGKAYAGSLKIAASAAPVLLTNAICHYYGIPV
ncbi:abortive phage resistance protein [Pectobacterium brasiliense]|uniref:AbiTii domain-containing protein n=1 Tax=Pectobacterium brasiliense TaxID=180957 RepID=UPI0019694511|nr:abortive phage resistance protein [Pectobacterium brasiliense]MBN3254546.1 abortive phage resistance protein [Pectobacterium brasiliense]